MHRNHLAAGLLCGTLLALTLSAARPAMAYPGMAKPAAPAPAHATLQKIAMAYTCPTDGQPVAGPGMCPRCAKEAAAHKIAVKDGKAAATAARKPVPAKRVSAS